MTFMISKKSTVGTDLLIAINTNDIHGIMMHWAHFFLWWCNLCLRRCLLLLFGLILLLRKVNCSRTESGLTGNNNFGWGIPWHRLGWFFSNFCGWVNRLWVVTKVILLFFSNSFHILFNHFKQCKVLGIVFNILFKFNSSLVVFRTVKSIPTCVFTDDIFQAGWAVGKTIFRNQSGDHVTLWSKQSLAKWALKVFYIH